MVSRDCTRIRVTFSVQAAPGRLHLSVHGQLGRAQCTLEH
jgi:hypothetical protein